MSQFRPMGSRALYVDHIYVFEHVTEGVHVPCGSAGSGTILVAEVMQSVQANQGNSYRRERHD